MHAPRILSATLLATLLVANAETSTSPTRNPKEASPSDRQFQAQEYPDEARKLVDTLATSIEDLTRLLQEAKASNDKKRMKAALDAGIAHLAYMKVSADKCKKKMEGMEGHKGMKKQAAADSGRAEPPSGDAQKDPSGDAHKGH